MMPRAEKKKKKGLDNLFRKGCNVSIGNDITIYIMIKGHILCEEKQTRNTAVLVGVARFLPYFPRSK